MILQYIFNLASLHADVELVAACRIENPDSTLLSVLGLATKGDITSIQVLYAA